MTKSVLKETEWWGGWGNIRKALSQELSELRPDRWGRGSHADAEGRALRQRPSHRNKPGVLQEARPVWLESNELGERDKGWSQAGRHMPHNTRLWQGEGLYPKGNEKHLKGLNKPGEGRDRSLIIFSYLRMKHWIADWKLCAGGACQLLASLSGYAVSFEYVQLSVFLVFSVGLVMFPRQKNLPVFCLEA